jgi:hypothetical protein
MKMKIFYIGFFGSIILCIGTIFFATPFFKNELLKYTDYEHNAAKVARVLDSWRFTQADKSDVPLRRYDRNASEKQTDSQVPQHTARARLAQ